MELEDFLKEKGILRIYCENMRAFQKDSRYSGERKANIGSFEWIKTPQGSYFWEALYMEHERKHPAVRYRPCDYFANHPILGVPPKCLKRL